MTAKPLPTDLPIQPFATSADFEAFLEREHTTAPGIYLKLAKKASNIPSITGAEAVEVALCFGWIDGRANGVDDKWWLVRYTPRRTKSIWSQKNVATIGRLVRAGKMRPAGLAAVHAAKSDGRWDRAYASPATITVPDDFSDALTGHEAAATFFAGLNKPDRYSVLWRVETASAKARDSRIQTTIEQLAVGKVPGTDAKGARKTKKHTETQKTVTKIAGKRKRRGDPNEVEESVLVPANPLKQPRREGLRRRPLED